MTYVLPALDTDTKGPLLKLHYGEINLIKPLLERIDDSYCLRTLSRGSRGVGERITKVNVSGELARLVGSKLVELMNNRCTFRSQSSGSSVDIDVMHDVLQESLAARVKGYTHDSVEMEHCPALTCNT